MDYLTIKEFSSNEFYERKSRFVGHAMPVTTKEQAEKFISEIKSKHYNATHNVSAYIINNLNLERFSDDGEPQGTAGIPVLEVLKKEKLNNICTVVTRYFGGIMLGAGGLVRAYSKGCKVALEASEYIKMCMCQRIKIEFEYNYYGKIDYILPEYNIKIEKSDFSDKVMLQIIVPISLSQKLNNQLIEATNNKITIVFLERLYADYPYEK